MHQSLILYTCTAFWGVFVLGNNEFGTHLQNKFFGVGNDGFDFHYIYFGFGISSCIVPISILVNCAMITKVHHNDIIDNIKCLQQYDTIDNRTYCNIIDNRKLIHPSDNIYSIN